MSEHKTLACPFCGSSDISDGEIAGTLPNHFNFSQSECNNCGACGSRAYLDPGEVDYGDVKAIAAWNTRSECTLQSENTTLRSQVESLLAVVSHKDEALRKIHNGAETRLHAQMIADEALSLKPSDVELVEVAAVDAMETGVEWNPLTLDDVKAGGKLYLLKQKEGV